MTPGEIGRAVDEYLEIGAFLDGGLQQQTRLDLDSLERATGRRLTPEERDRVSAAQLKALRWTFIGSGITLALVWRSLAHIAHADEAATAAA